MIYPNTFLKEKNKISIHICNVNTYMYKEWFNFNIESKSIYCCNAGVIFKEIFLEDQNEKSIVESN